jgi:TolB-like protein/Tfp pilus assembly protein PilF
MASFEISLLGGVQIRSADGSVIEVAGGRKERALLAILAMPPGATRSRDKLAGMLWSERGDKQARDSLKQALLKLRKSFGDEASSPFLADRDSVTLDSGAVTVDAAKFERLICEGTTEALTRALSLYRGDLLDGIDLRDPAFDEWLIIQRQRLRDMAREALARLLDHHLASDSRDQAGAIARQLLTLDPLREAAHRALMRIYADQGQTALALKQYRLCRDALQGELGVKPEAETERLYKAIQEKRAAARQIASQAAPALAAAEVRPQADPSAPAQAGEAPSSSTTRSIAVLPFANLSADAEQQYFSDGITEDIITALSRYRSLLVIARNSCFQFRKPSVDLAMVRRKLNVQFIVEGSIRKIGRRLRLTVQLIDATTEAHVWAERYDREVEDVFAVQDEVARAVAATLEGRVAARGAEEARRRPTKDWGAYDYFLQGREQYYRYRFIEAESYFALASELDPGYAQAYALRALALPARFWRDLQADAMPRALDCARKALSLDDSDGWSHMAMGFVLTHRGQGELAGPYFDRAVALNPTDVQIATIRAWWLTRRGRTEEALESLDSLLQRDPFPPAWFWEGKGIALFQARRYEEAIAALSRLREGYGWDHAYIAACHAYLNRPQAARAAAAETLGADPHFTLARYAQVEGYTAPADLDHLLEGMRRAGLPE